jgi:hypothetical protein
MNAARHRCLPLVFIGLALNQQVGSVDLTRSAPTTVHQQPIPAGCKEITPSGTGDGWQEPEDHQPRHIAVVVLTVKPEKLTPRTEVEATVELRNGDTKPIQIPWSTDASVKEEGLKLNAFQWQAGTFDFTLKNDEGHQIRLKSVTEWLYGSQFVPGSWLIIQPGQNIRASVRFRVEDLYSIEPLPLKEGNWQLSAEWRQVGRTLSIKNCKAWNGYFRYDHFYAQDSPPLTVQVISASKTKPILQVPISLNV